MGKEPGGASLTDWPSTRQIRVRCDRLLPPDGVARRETTMWTKTSELRTITVCLGGLLMKALIVIDMLEDFIEKEGALYVGQEGEELIPFINQKIQEFRQAGHHHLHR